MSTVTTSRPRRRSDRRLCPGGRRPRISRVRHRPRARRRIDPDGQLVDRLTEIDRSQPVFVICQAGGRSSAMTDVLRHHGFDAHSVEGGTAAWIADGHPVDLSTAEGKCTP
jgi:rhodanese-related sulfurtransferase